MIEGLAAGTGRMVAFRRLRDAFREAGLATPELDARVLLCAALGIAAEDLARDPDSAVDRAGASRLGEFAARRLGREPVARIVGVREFFGLAFRVGPATLVPRPDTETLVEAVLDAIAAAGNRAAPSIADLGTGSGCILVSLLSALPVARGTGVDIATEAIGVARANAAANGVGERARFVVGDFSVLAGETFDVVVSNPPYIESGVIADLQAEVARFEPSLALDGGPDGLDAYRRIAALGARLVVAGGLLALEVGVGQAAVVAGLLEHEGFAEIEVRRDLAGIERVVLARRPIPA